MTEKIGTYWKSLDRKITVNQRELVLGVAVCALAGIVVGIVLSPKKSVTIGSHNGSNNSGNSAMVDASPDGEEEAEEA